MVSLLEVGELEGLRSSPECTCLSEGFRKEKNMTSLKKGRVTLPVGDCKIEPNLDTGNFSQHSSPISSPAATLWKIRDKVGVLHLEKRCEAEPRPTLGPH